MKKKLEPLFVANEAYQGTDAIEPLVKTFAKAQELYMHNDKHGAFKVLVAMADQIEDIFNFKSCSIQVNETAFGIGWTSSCCRFVIGNGDTKYITYSDIEQAEKTYRFKMKIANCNLAIYAPNMLNSANISPKEAVAIIIREVGRSFFIWGTGRKAQEGISNALSVITAATSKDNALLDKIVTAAFAAWDYIPGQKLPNTGGKDHSIGQVVSKLLSAIGDATIVVLMPLIGIVNLFSLPFRFLSSAVDKLFGVNFDDADKFADQFCASYGLAGELASAMQREKGMNFTSENQEYGRAVRIYADILGGSALAYTLTSGRGGCKNNGMALPRIEAIIHYYEDMLNEINNPAIKKELQEKIKALKMQYDYLSKLPTEKWSPSAMVARVWGALFGADTQNIDNFDRNITNGKVRRRQ